jgi:hypothetical protein
MDDFNDGYAKGAEVACYAFGSVINEYVSENEKLRRVCAGLVSRLRVAEEQLEMDGALLDMRLVGDLRELGVEVDG